jgi:hypothetical protein
MLFDFTNQWLTDKLQESIFKELSYPYSYFADNYKPKNTPLTPLRVFEILFDASDKLEYPKHVWEELKSTTKFTTMDKLHVPPHPLYEVILPNGQYDSISNTLFFRKGHNDFTVYVHEIGHALYHLYHKNNKPRFIYEIPFGSNLLDEYAAQLFEKLCSERLGMNLYWNRHRLMSKKLQEFKTIDLENTKDLINHEAIYNSFEDHHYPFACLMAKYTDINEIIE